MRTISERRRRVQDGGNKQARGFKLALVQMPVVPGNPERNLEVALAQVALAARAGAQVVLLPETADLGWTFPGARRKARTLHAGPFGQALCHAARRHGVYVCSGLTERAGPRVYNAAVLISPTGKIVLHHRKLNELEIGHMLYDQGDRLGVVETPWGAFGLMICADGYLEGHFVLRTLGLMGASVILSPSAWAVPPGWDNRATPYGTDWQRQYAAVAGPFCLWIAACSNVGQVIGGAWDGYSCIGNSLLVGPDGQVAARGRFGADAAGTIYHRVVPQSRPARGGGWASYWRTEQVLLDLQTAPRTQ